MKQSTCNFIHESEVGELYLYNSLKGTNSLIYVEPAKASKIREILNLKYQNEKDNDYQLLVDNGYLIQDDDDEMQAKEYKYFKVVGDPRLNITILPTEKCNFRCVYCYETFEKPQMSIETQENLINFVKRNIQNYTGLSVHWFGGEPLIAMDVIESLSVKFMEICKNAKKTYIASMTTNGYLLDMQMLNRLIQYQVYKYQITIDGIEKTHDIQRPLLNGAPTFHTIVNNLKEIRLHNKNKFVHFTIRTNLSKSIFKNLDKCIETLHEICQEDARFSLYLHQVSDWGGERIDEIKDELISRDMYAETLKRIKESGHQFNYNVHFGRLDSEACVCYANKLNYFIVGADGTIYKCSGNFEDYRNKIGFMTEKGNVHINKEKEALWVCNIKRLKEKCKTCYFSGNCLSGICPAIQVRSLTDSFCSFEKKYLGYFLELFNKGVYKIIN